MARLSPSGLGHPLVLTAATGPELISLKPYASAAAPSTLPAAAPMAWRRLRRMSGTFISRPSLQALP